MRRLLLAACVALLGLGRMAGAQTGSTTEGALDLIRLIGARSVAMGQATVAAGTGVEAVWGNPALVARSGREAALTARNKSNAADPETDAGGVAVFPVRPVGTVAIGFRYINNGQFDAVNRNGQQTGTFVSTNTILSATFATTFGNRLAAGFTVKRLSLGTACTGDCNPDQTNAPSASRPAVTALDFGGQLIATGDSALSLGIAVQNLGPKLQIIDSPQADPLPSRASVGVLYAPKLPKWPDVRLRAAADVVTRISGGTGPGYRLGGEVSYQDRYHLRGGYIVNGPGEINSPTLGFGVSTGNLNVDLAQMVTDLGAQSARPTFLTIRYSF